ncbi:MAG TPA: SGNH/GDSL hydrolase family protein, partial [Candidatus Obscuribacterales bacterium]
AAQRSPQTLRVLLLGDSIANGGWWTDQPHILSAQLQRQLSSALAESYTTVEVLNASANSWGPRNELAYVSKFGTFEAQIVVVLLNTDDLFATAPTSAQVGRDRAYPKHYPPLALIEVLSRFQRPQTIPELDAVQAEGGDRVGANLEAIRQMQSLVRRSGSQLVVAMTPLRREVLPPGARDYELQARDRVTQFMTLESIVYLDCLSLFQTAADPATLYRDHIHLSPPGYALVVAALSPVLQAELAKAQGLPAALPDSLLDDPW